MTKRRAPHEYALLLAVVLLIGGSALYYLYDHLPEAGWLFH